MQGWKGIDINNIRMILSFAYKQIMRTFKRRKKVRKDILKNFSTICAVRSEPLVMKRNYKERESKI